jgi:multiple sugar transport system permease protein
MLMFLIIVVLSIAMFYLMRDRGEQKLRKQETGTTCVY